jgi:hypothetical protein
MMVVLNVIETTACTNRLALVTIIHSRLIVLLYFFGLSRQPSVAMSNPRKTRGAIAPRDNARRKRGDNNAKDNSYHYRRVPDCCIDNADGSRRRKSPHPKDQPRAGERAIPQQQRLCRTGNDPTGLVAVQRWNVGARGPLISSASKKPRKHPGLF